MFLKIIGMEGAPSVSYRRHHPTRPRGYIVTGNDVKYRFAFDASNLSIAVLADTERQRPGVRCLQNRWLNRWTLFLRRFLVLLGLLITCSFSLSLSFCSFSSFNGTGFRNKRIRLKSFCNVIEQADALPEGKPRSKVECYRKQG